MDIRDKKMKTIIILLIVITFVLLNIMVILKDLAAHFGVAY